MIESMLIYMESFKQITMAQTATEWLFVELTSTWYDAKSSKDLLEKAKAIEKENIQKAFSDGQETPLNHPNLPNYSGEEYYNDTYNK